MMKYVLLFVLPFVSVVSAQADPRYNQATSKWETVDLENREVKQYEHLRNEFVQVSTRTLTADELKTVKEFKVNTAPQPLVMKEEVHVGPKASEPSIRTRPAEPVSASVGLLASAELEGGAVAPPEVVVTTTPPQQVQPPQEPAELAAEPIRISSATKMVYIYNGGNKETITVYGLADGKTHKLRKVLPGHVFPVNYKEYPGVTLQVKSGHWWMFNKHTSDPVRFKGNATWVWSYNEGTREMAHQNHNVKFIEGVLNGG